MHKPEPSIIVIFGASGDLTKRKLFPAIYTLEKERLLPNKFAIVGTAVDELSNDEFRRRMKAAVEHSSEAAPVNNSTLESLARRIHYTRGDFKDQESYKKLADFLSQVDQDCGTCSNRMFYLATPPSLCPDIVRGLSQAGLAQTSKGWSRIVIEKPFGSDLDSARSLNEDIGRFFREDQIYRIDHYLGKETVQNVLVFRFSSGIFEPIWNRRYVDHVQITAAEELGVEHRAAYYEEAGALRDMVQSHMFQLLALTAMEPPLAFEAGAVRDEKVKALRAVQHLTPEEISRFVVRGQYGDGKIRGKKVKAYRDEPDIKPDSQTETFVALKLAINNWRWAGVPFYLRTGKRLHKRTTEIVLHFKQPPFPIFGHVAAKGVTTNFLTIRIQPEEGISLRVNAKVPGITVEIQPVAMDFSYADTFRKKSVSAYERLLHDCLLGDATLFARRDGIETAWSIVTPILEAWEEEKKLGKIPIYEAGSWGPKEADELIQKDGREWGG